MTYESWRISYQSSEQAARAAYAECARLCARLEAAEKERDALQAKVDAMERQEPICLAEDLRYAENLLPALGLMPEDKLYALPGAKGEEK